MTKIKLTQEQYAIVDDDSVGVLPNIRWFAQWSRWTKSYYATGWIGNGRKGRKWVSMHGIIAGNPQMPLMVDHINHDTLDNRKSNLRVVTRSQNTLNRKTPTVSRGSICLVKRQHRSFWQVYKGKHYIGTAQTEQEAKSKLASYLQSASE